MGASLLTKSGGNTSSTQFAGLINRALKDGVIYGCECAVSSGGINIESGVIVVSGFMIAIDGETITPTSGNEVVVKINISDGSATIVTRETAALTQEDVFNGGDEYEVQLAIYTISGSSVTSVTRTLEKASAETNTYTGSTEPTNASKGDIWLVTE